jgi:V8-like Glu-specific endopeptidase
MRSASGGNPAVGAMFSTSGGRLGTHFCTASVIDSPAGDLLVTAAHCVNGFSDASPANLAFVPGFANGTALWGLDGHPHLRRLGVDVQRRSRP